MSVNALVALIIWKTYDKIGMTSLIIIPLLTLPIPFFAFSHSYSLAIVGAVLWGAVLGIHETIMRAAIADITSIKRRCLAYGILIQYMVFRGYLKVQLQDYFTRFPLAV